MTIDKFQKLFETMGLHDEVCVTLDVSEVSIILSLLKSNEAYCKVLEENLEKMFDKLEHQTQ